jgi:hypothetical protein
MFVVALPSCASTSRAPSRRRTVQTLNLTGHPDGTVPTPDVLQGAFQPLV